MSKRKPLPSLARLKELLAYNAENGEIFWKSPKQPSMTGRRAGYIDSKGYRHVRLEGSLYAVHRVIWKMATGQTPPKYIDHVNGIRTDNRFCNLRGADASQNAQNRRIHKNNATGFKGVARGSTNTWRAMIEARGRSIHLGYFKTPELAHEAYLKKAQELHGEFARAV